MLAQNAIGFNTGRTCRRAQAECGLQRGILWDIIRIDKIFCNECNAAESYVGREVEK